MQPSTPPPNHKVFFLCIGYSSPPDNSDPANRPRPLQGPLNDAEEMKTALTVLYSYREEDIFTMTDEKKNAGTKQWPSKQNILRAMVNFTRNATPRGALVFYYSGHGGRDDEGDHTCAYILTCDDEKIFDYEIRQHLVDTLPWDCRLTAILDACHSGMLLNLEYYNHHCFMHGCSQSDAALEPWVISVAACTSNENTWEDTEEGGKGMTAELIEILRKNPSILVVDLVQQLRKSLSELALDRRQQTRDRFKTLTADLPLGTIIESKQACMSRGTFELKSQTPQIGSLNPLRLDDQFILKQNHTGDVFH